MFPVRDIIPSERPPFVTLALIGANGIVFLFQLSLPDIELERLVYHFGVVPVRFTDRVWAASAGFSDSSYWAFLTSLFLHGGWLHLISNMWSLWIFGDNVEDRMGRLRFLAYYLLCGLAASIAHTVVNASSTTPAIGASGAIAGVMAAYLLLFPFSRIVCLAPIFFYPVFIQVPAFLFILIWFWSQFFTGSLSLLAPSQAGGIAWWAHIGGFLSGVLLHRFFLARRSDRRGIGRKSAPSRPTHRPR